MNEAKVILISGASTGIGRSAAHHLAGQGHQVFAGVRNLSVTFDHPGVTPVLLDVQHLDSMQKAVETVVAKTGGRIDVLINNAGIAVLGPLEGVGTKGIRDQFDINVFGLFELTRLTLPYLKRSQGHVINVSSVSGLFTTPFTGLYCASKYAVESLSDSWRVELLPFGVKVILIEPGPIQSEIWKKSVWFWDPNLSAKETAELQTSYARANKAFDRLARGTIKKAKPTALVNRALDHALFSKRPRARYVVNGNGLALRLIRFLPERWIDALFMKVLQKYGADRSV